MADIKEVCQPLSNIEELLEYMDDHTVKYTKTILPLSQRTNNKIKSYGFKCHNVSNSKGLNEQTAKHWAPKTIVCHDFKGGYLDDKFPEGSNDVDNYVFVYWAGIDTFVYFAHHLVTIPPVGWINAAHRNGVPILATFITEFQSGEKICEIIFQSEDVLNTVIDNLVKICRFYKFDGYFINIENKVQSPEKVVKFVGQLKRKLLDIGPHTQVIWYDSITFPDGNLEWQNALNYSNKHFFDVCDGIFLNYSWNPQDLLEIAKFAGARQFDVYVGVDVFGRNMFGGGGLNTVKAITEINKVGLSVALFAPGWTDEQSKIKTVEAKLSLDIFFWHINWEFLYIHGPAEMPFKTCFNIGRGFNYFTDGQITLSKPWFNLNLQDPQPCIPYCVTHNEEQLHNMDVYNYCVRLYTSDAYNGGTCLIINKPKWQSSAEHCYVKLFLCEFSCSDVQNCDGLAIKFTIKPLDKFYSDLCLVLLIQDDKTGSKRKVYLCSEYASKMLKETSAVHPDSSLIVNSVTNEIISADKKESMTSVQNGWFTRKYSYKTDGTIIEIGALHLGLCPVLLGKISIQQQQKKIQQ